MRSGHTTEQPPPDRRVGTILRGKYHIDRVLGAGGMGVVYKATHRNEAEFAIKMLHPEWSLREDLRARFLREGKVANSIKHPGVVRVVDDDVAEDGAAFLVMELLEGAAVETLWQREGCRLPVAIVVSVVDQLLDVLAAAHEKDVVHRDIKPANLFVLRDGTLKVLDFGIARVKDAAGGQNTGTGTVMGTAAYMAPEQAFGKAREIDAQTDLWAVGATMFTLLSGRLVHQGENAAQLLVLAATQRATPVREVLPDLPPGLAEVIDRAIGFDKSDRWASAAAMRHALGQACAEALGERPWKLPLAALLAGTRRDGPQGSNERVETLLADVPDGLFPMDGPRGRTTAQPVSSRAASSTPPESRAAPSATHSARRAAPARTIGLIAVPLFVTLGMGVFLARGRLHGDGEKASAQSFSATIGPIAPASLPSPTAAAPALPPAATATADGGYAAEAAELDAALGAIGAPEAMRATGATLDGASTATRTGIAAAARPAHSVPAWAPPPPRPTATVDCDPPTWVDAKGHVHLKTGCQ